MTDDIAYLSLADVTEAYRGGALSPVEVTEIALERISRLEPTLNAFCHVAPEESVAAARAAEARWRRGEPLGALDGVPITVKDMVLAKGWPTLRGSKVVDPDQDWSEDAPAVARAREHGAVILGKTTMSEFGWKGVTDSPLCGVTRNPWNTDTTPGGSSGGSAAALAAGIGHASIGTDAGSSVRIPGAFTGLVAMKASVGRVPNYPPSAAGTLGHVGPICRTVRDTARLLDIMSVPDARDWLCLPRRDASFLDSIDDGVGEMTIAFSPTLGYAKVDPTVATLVERAAASFEKLAARVERVEAPFDDPTECFRTHFFAGIAHSLRSLSEDQLALLDPGLSRVVQLAKNTELESFQSAADQRAALGRTNRLFHERFDLLVTPTLAVPAFEAGRLSPDGYDQEDWLPWSPFTYPFNLTGQPAITVPCGFTEQGLPVGLQIVGPIHGDELVLRAAQAYRGAHSTLERRPPI
jgi:aspartyl-tRNA(Asn)/glutamyl-tRNA(Gln) amidotransferase subunit A